MNALAQLVKRGRTYDIYEPRTTHRMHVTLTVLAAAGIEPTITHGTRTLYDWPTHRERHWCSLDGSGNGDCRIEWPAWVTDEMFDAAWNLASDAISKRGEYNRNAADRAARERFALAR